MKLDPYQWGYFLVRHTNKIEFVSITSDNKKVKKIG